MDTAAAPVSLKGMRWPLLLIAISGFVIGIAGPILGPITSGALAFGLRGTRHANAPHGMVRWSAFGEFAAWCACAIWLAMLFLLVPFPPYVLAQALAQFAAATALARLAAAAGSDSTARGLLIVRWLLLAPAAQFVVPGLVSFSSLPGWALTALGLVWFASPGASFYFGMLALRLRKAAPSSRTVRLRTLPA